MREQMDLLYFSDITQLDYVLKKNPEYLQSLRPITSDMTVAFELQLRKIKFIDVWNFIENEEIEKNWNDAHTISQKWWGETKANVLYGVENLCVAAQQDFIYALEACLNSKTAYKKILEKYQVRKLYGFFMPPVAVVRTGPAPVTRAVRSVSESVLFFLADHFGIEVTEITADKSLSRRMKKRAKTCRNEYQPFDFNDIKSKDGSRVVIIYKHLMPNYEYDAIISALDDDENITPITISENDLEFGALQNLSESSILGKINDFWVEFWRESKNYSSHYPEIYSNKYLRFQFDGIKDEMIIAARNGAVFETFLEVIKPSVIIFGHEAFTRERVLVGLAQERDILTVGMFHGGAGHLRGSRGIAGRVDMLAVWNNLDASLVESYGRKSESIIKLGSLAGDISVGQYKSRKEHDESCQNKVNAKKNNLSGNRNLTITLLTSEINTDFAAPVASPPKHRSFFLDFLELAKRKPDWQFYIKPHPSFDYYDLYNRLQSSDCPNIIFVEGSDLKQLLRASDVCVIINYCSTAAVEAMLLEVPTVYIDSGVFPLSCCAPCLSDVGLPRVKSTRELEDYINMLFDDSRLYEKHVALAKNQVVDFLGVDDMLAKDRFKLMINNLLVFKEPGTKYTPRDVHFFRDVKINKPDKLLSILVSPEHELGSSLVLYVYVFVSGIYQIDFQKVQKNVARILNDKQCEDLDQSLVNEWTILAAYINGLSKNRGIKLFAYLTIIVRYMLQARILIGMPYYLKKNIAMVTLHRLCYLRFRVVGWLHDKFTISKKQYG